METVKALRRSEQLAARADLRRRGKQLAETVQEHLDHPSAASRDQLRQALTEYRDAERRT